MHSFLSNVKKHIRPKPDSPSSSHRQPSHSTPLFTYAESHEHRRLVDSGTEQSRRLEVKNVIELGNVRSSLTSVKRDLGFHGRLGQYAFNTYGDTMFGSGDQFRGMTCNSIAIATTSPTEVLDPLLNDNSYPHCFLPPDQSSGEDPSSWSLGITNIIEIAPGEGIFYFLLNHRPDGKDNIVGAGVATITLDTSSGTPVPVPHRLSKYWWDGETEPHYGDVCALRADDHIYAYGHAKDNPWVYLTRVNAEHATDLNSYEYWNGTGWRAERLKRDELTEQQSIFWQINQGQIYWSKYHNCFIFIYCDNFWSCQVLAKTASSPEGPWSEPQTVYKPRPIEEGGNVYAAVPHPYYDPSGETLVTTFTNHPNTIQAIQVEFTDATC